MALDDRKLGALALALAAFLAWYVMALSLEIHCLGIPDISNARTLIISPLYYIFRRSC